MRTSDLSSPDESDRPISRIGEVLEADGVSTESTFDEANIKLTSEIEDMLDVEGMFSMLNASTTSISEAELSPS